MPHPVDIHVGKRLRQKRSVMGISQNAIGNELGVTFQQVQKYERGVNRVSSSRLFDFAKILRVPVSYFFEGFEDEDYKNHGFAEDGESFEKEDLFTNKDSVQLLRLFNKIKNPDLRKRVIDLVKAIASEKN
jgi:transcriptional regulator with XRE-family HTH domain